eukprot:TRINITY_DN2916_c0_g2::TRINITY_DN2916_c0_g2_i1::g.4274::m.4274 TRINITY_DN2916_c0_g2::TRINITY_DN2916_c0_g2_i1::g.4274  ORF type:complete len:213 (-),score=9.17,Dynactin_p22/PF07426.6/1.2e-05,RDM/PF11002.3/1.3e+02,RDM/PF11002.3/0.1 TRINITY_DN2916_c0_g2_i1:332-877(-)
MEVLEQRICDLEQTVLGNESKSLSYRQTLQRQALTKRIQTLSSSLNLILFNNPELAKLVSTVSRVEPQLNSKQPLPLSTTLEVLKSSEPFIKSTVSSLQSLEVLNNPQYLQIPSAEEMGCVKRRLRECQENNVHLAAHVDSFATEVDELVSTHENLVGLLCQQFIQWDDTLRQWEQAVAAL